jgi:hypothetical protein
MDFYNWKNEEEVVKRATLEDSREIGGLKW